MVNLLLHEQLNSMSFLGVSPSAKIGHKIRVKQCLSTNMSRMKDVTNLDAKSSTTFSHLKDIHTSMNYWFMNQMSTTYHAPTLSQLVAS
jgi:hypothetical protein